MQPLFGRIFGPESGITNAIAYISEGVELSEDMQFSNVHIRSIIEARQMTLEWALAKDEDYVEGWEPGKWY